MQNMNAQQIKARLLEIEALEAAHNARDFDAELSKVMREGGDVDALEAAQLEAERYSRRCRVERQALQARLPEVEKAEALALVQDMAKQFVGDAELFKAAARAVEKAREDEAKSLSVCYRLNAARANAFHKVNILATKHGLGNEVLSPFYRLHSFRLDIAHSAEQSNYSVPFEFHTYPINVEAEQ